MRLQGTDNTSLFYADQNYMLILQTFDWDTGEKCIDK